MLRISLTKQYCERYKNVTYGKKYFLLDVEGSTFIIRDDKGRKARIQEMYISCISPKIELNYPTYREMFQGIGGQFYNYIKDKNTVCINDVWNEYLLMKQDIDLSTRRQIAVILNKMKWLEPLSSVKTKYGTQRGWRFKEA